MNVTIKINNKSTKANSIINMLKTLAEDYDFVEIYEDESFPESTLKELEKRLEYSLAHPEDGISWEEMEKAWKDKEEVKYFLQNKQKKNYPYPESTITNVALVWVMNLLPTLKIRQT